MTRNESPEEARDRKIAELTEQLFQARLAKLAQPAVLRDVGNSVLDYLAHAEDLHKLVLGETTFVAVRDHVMRSEAEVDAIKAVERMEQHREDEARRDRIERRIWDRAFA
jgi:hypothetical protein